jgi:hypothetical protein
MLQTFKGVALKREVSNPRQITRDGMKFELGGKTSQRYKSDEFF